MLPVRPGSASERAAIDVVLARAEAAGASGARRFGYPGGGRVGRGESLHAVLMLCGLALADVARTPAFALLVVTLFSAAARGLGGRGLDAWWPKRPTWAVWLASPGPETRRLCFATLDRAVPDRLLRQLGLLFAAVTVVAVALPVPARIAVGIGVLAFGLVASRWGARRATAGAAESRAVAALVEIARGGVPRDTAVVVSGSTSDGEGILAALDWGACRRVTLTWVTGAVGHGGRWEPARGWLAAGSPAPAFPEPVVRALVAHGYPVDVVGGPPGAAAAEPEQIVRELRAHLGFVRGSGPLPKDSRVVEGSRSGEAAVGRAEESVG